MKPGPPVVDVHTDIAKTTAEGQFSAGFRQQYRLVTTLAQAVLDFCTMLTGNALAYWLYLTLDLGKHHVDPSLYWTLNFLTSLGAVLIFSSVGVYRETVGMVNIEETRRLIRGVFFALVAVFVGSFFIREYSFSRITAVLAVPINFFCLYLQRWAMALFHRALHRKGLGVRRCLIYGAYETGIVIARRFFQNLQLGWVPVGFLGSDVHQVGKSHRVTAGPDGRQVQVLGVLEDLETLARRHEITDLVVAVAPDEDKQLVERGILLCQRLGIHCHFVYAHVHLLWNSYELRNLDGIPLLSPREGQFVTYDIVKRGYDLVVSSFLLMLLSPVWLVITLNIKYDSAGPVLFRQKRVGQGGREFTIYKFRTMYADSPPYETTPSSEEDQRITRIGRLLRRSSLDELPQLINVFKGDMSLVGPRPEMPFIVATYSDYQRQRLQVKPGVTGLWQISEDRAFQIHDNIEYDLYYIANRSFSLDLAILFQTVFSVFRGVGAW